MSAKQNEPHQYFRPTPCGPGQVKEPAAPGTSEWAADYIQYNNPLRDAVAFVAVNKDGSHREVQRETLIYSIPQLRRRMHIAENVTDLEFMTPPFPVSALGNPDLDHWEFQAADMTKCGKK